MGLMSALALASGITAASAQEPTDVEALRVLEEAAARYQSTSSLCADFTQELSVPLLGEKRSGRGRLCQKQPDLFMMRFTEPAGDVVVADGEWLWVYFPSNDAKQVLRAALGTASGAFDFHREFLDRPREKYAVKGDGQATIDGETVHRLVLTPLRAAAYREALLWIEAGSAIVRRVEIHEENGNVRAVSLANVQLGMTPAVEAFRFTPPPGTQVITR